MAPPEQKPLRIGIAVQGIFITFDLGREIVRLGHELVLCTNHRASEAVKFGIPKACVESLYLHRLFSALVARIPLRWIQTFCEPILHIWFSKWAARRLAAREPDVIFALSGVAEDIFKQIPSPPPLRFTGRFSSHIRTQHALLADEEKRAGTFIEKPSPWRIAREEREYKLSDAVIVLSQWTEQTMRDHGCENVRLLKSGNQVSHFRPEPEVIEARCRRILSGAPLHVLMVGSFSFQKGALDLVALASMLQGENFKFTFVGDVPRECLELQAAAADNINFIPRQPHFSLPNFYANGDLFVFPTVQDGAPAVLGQAQAAGLPILATPNSSAPDIVEQDKNGWVLPLRSPADFAERLRHCESHREELVAMIRHIYGENHQRDFEDVAADFLLLCSEDYSHPAAIGKRGSSSA